MPKTTVEICRERFQRAQSYYSTSRQAAIADTKFVLGDSDNNWQWDDTIVQARTTGRNQKPCLTINITAQHCNQVENEIRQNRPAAKVVPVDSDSDPGTANIIGGMIRSIQAYSNADTAHDIASQHAIYGGEGYWRVLTDYESADSFDQVILIKALVNPQLVYIDPDSIEPDGSDAKWGMIFEDIPRKEADDQYAEQSLNWADDGKDAGWCTKDTVRRAEYFYRVDTDDTLYLLNTGKTIKKSALPEGAKVSVKDKIGSIQVGDQMALVLDTRPTQVQQWKWCRIVGGSETPEDEKDWPGAYLPIIRVVGKEVNVNGDVVRKGLVRDLKDQGRMVNYSASTAVETVALQPKAPFLAAAEAIEGHEDKWAVANTEAASFLPYNAFDAEGQALPVPQRAAPAQFAAAQVQLLQLFTDQMRGASGQQNANFGIKSEASSGVGIQRLKAQGEIATFHFPDNLARALKYEATVIVDLIPKVYDRQRIVRILGLDGKETAAMLDPGHEGPARDINQEGLDQVFNPSVGRYDVHIDTGPSYQTQRQEASDALTQLAHSSPKLMEVAPDLVVQAFDFPMAQEIADRLKRTVPAQILGDEKDPEAQMQAQLQQQQQHMQEMIQQGQMLEQQLAEAQQKLQVLEMEKKASFYKEQAETSRADQENLIAAYQAETARIAAMAPTAATLDPQALDALLEQKIMEMLTRPIPLQAPASPQLGMPPPQAMQPMNPPAMAGAGPYPDPGYQPAPQEGNPNV